MLEPGQLAAFAAASLVLVAVPGPNTVYISTRSMAQGIRAGVVSVLGVETGTAVYVSATALGLSALIVASPVAFNIIRYLGVGYLVYLAIRELTARSHDNGGVAGDGAQRRLARVYLDGVLVNLLNPKVALFFVAFLPQFLTEDADSADAQVEILALGLVMILIALAIDLLYAAAAGRIAGALRERPSRRNGRWRRIAVASVYLAIALGAALGALPA